MMTIDEFQQEKQRLVALFPLELNGREVIQYGFEGTMFSWGFIDNPNLKLSINYDPLIIKGKG